MRNIHTHLAEGDKNNKVGIAVLDEPGAGGANHHYVVDGFNLKKNKSYTGPFDTTCVEHSTSTHIYFQNGGILDNSVNGLTNEALLAVVEDRLSCFQAGPYPSVENSEALAHVRKALAFLHSRTQDRIKRQVEGMELK
jgi:hypothetical protein